MKIIGVPSFFHRYSLIKKISVFSKFNFVDLQRIARNTTLEEYKKGEIICKQGTPAEAFYCLISGRVRGYSVDPNGQKHNVEFIRRGMHFGVAPLLTKESHPKNFEVFNDAIILRIENDDFQKILNSHPQLGVELSRSLSKEIQSKAGQCKTTFERKIISIYSPVKGSGVSTYAINLALSLQHETGKKVVFVNIAIFAILSAGLNPPAPPVKSNIFLA